VSIGPLEASAPGATTLRTDGDEVWILLAEKLGALVAAEYARQCSSSAVERELKEALGLAQAFVRHLVARCRQATEELHAPEQQAAARAAIHYVFALDAPIGPRPMDRKHR